MARELNDCTNPIAVYFDDRVRNQCLKKKLANNKDVRRLKKIDQKVKEDAKNIRNNFQELAKRHERSNVNYEDHQSRFNEAPELLAAKQAFIDLSGVVTSIKTQYQENKTNLENVVNEYENTFNKNIEFIVEVGNSLVNKLYSNIYTKKFEKKRKALVDNYNKIRAYLEKIGESKGALRDLTKEEISGK
jgi:mevalonate kinase